MAGHHTLNAEPGRYRVEVSPARGLLGAIYTGRSIDIDGRYAQAKRWVDSYEHSPEAHSELEEELLESLVPGALDSAHFRGRFFSTSPESWSCFGPPPSVLAKAGRYNPAGSSALYLASSKDGVERELSNVDADGDLWIQQFRLVPELRLADARNLGTQSLAAAVFWLLESSRERDRFLCLGHRLGQLVATEFDGLIVPGVRGEPTQLYWNVVIFRPHNRWTQLVDKHAQPHKAPRS
jgi:hypothetical protein